MKNTSAYFGKTGEEIAAMFLESKGWQVIDRNYRKPWGELDIVAKDPEGILVFVEVKTLSMSAMFAGEHDEHLTPEDNMSAAKIKKTQRIAGTYASHHPEHLDEERGWRIDLVAVDLVEGESARVRHYENI